jgi:hypothetical protein
LAWHPLPGLEEMVAADLDVGWRRLLQTLWLHPRLPINCQRP